MIPNLTLQTNIFMLNLMNKKKVTILIILIITIWGTLAYFVLDFAKKEEIDITAPLVKVQQRIIGSKRKNTVFESDISATRTVAG